MPDTFELPRMRCTVIPLMRSGFAVIAEFVSYGIPCDSPIIRSLNHLSKPARDLRGIDAIRIYWRSLEVIDLPTRKVRPGY
jgi:hypothetical protein